MKRLERQPNPSPKTGLKECADPNDFTPEVYPNIQRRSTTPFQSLLKLKKGTHLRPVICIKLHRKISGADN